jgi:hypothetical protein
MGNGYDLNVIKSNPNLVWGKYQRRIFIFLKFNKKYTHIYII